MTGILSSMKQRESKTLKREVKSADAVKGIPSSMNKREFKTLTFEVKSADAVKGIVDAYVSIFGNVDYGYDVMMPGAFDKTLAKWAASGDPIPVIWSHDWENPNAHIGVVTSALQDSIGLRVQMQYDLDKPFAKQVFDLMLARRVKEFSFGYMPIEWAYASTDTGSVRQLIEVDLFEVGPCLVGMNPGTQLLEAASLASADESALKAAGEIIAEALRKTQSAFPPPANPPVDPEVKTDEGAARDAGATIDSERVIGLLTKTRYREV